MTATLVQQFIKEECTPDVRVIIQSALAALHCGSGPTVNKLEFNRFELTLDGEKGVAVLEDVLDPSSTGLQRLTLDELEKYLEQT